ncbi:hypothetical protein Hanom_Chr07g00622961 [Helianthus anomalus]
MREADVASPAIWSPIKIAAVVRCARRQASELKEKRSSSELQQTIAITVSHANLFILLTYSVRF